VVAALALRVPETIAQTPWGWKGPVQLSILDWRFWIGFGNPDGAGKNEKPESGTGEFLQKVAKETKPECRSQKSERDAWEVWEVWDEMSDQRIVVTRTIMAASFNRKSS
jgi:hypothetical protein